MVVPLFSGFACRLYTVLPAGAAYTRILRKTADTFSGPTDPAADLVIDSFAEDSLVDISVLNDTEYFWHAWDWIGSAWVDGGPSLSATPATRYVDDTTDPQELVRDRVQLGINAEIVRGSLKPRTGAIKVTTAPFALADGIDLPTISVHLESTGPAERAIGDELEDFADLALGNFVGTEGWLARFALTVAAVSLNADERIALRKALRRIIQANLPIFNDFGLALVEFQQTDSEQFGENAAPLYMSNGAFSCIAPTYVRDLDGALSDVTATAIPLNPTTGQLYP